MSCLKNHQKAYKDPKLNIWRPNHSKNTSLAALLGRYAYLKAYLTTKEVQ